MNRKYVSSRLLAACCLASLTGCSPETTEPGVTGEEGAVGQQRAELDYSPGAGWNLAWSDEFEGTGLNAGNWTTLNSNWDPVTNNCNFGTGSSSTRARRTSRWAAAC